MAQQEIIKDTQEDSKIKPLETIYFLMIKVCGAKDLERADFTGSSDPFCKVVANKQSWSTQVIKQNLNPKWDEETSFVFFDAVDEIEFIVFDWDKGSKHDCIGKCTLATNTFYNPQSKGFSGSIALKEAKKGSIDVVVTGRMVKPLELEQRCVTLEAQSKSQREEIARKEAECQKLMKQNAEDAEKKNKYLKDQQDLNDQLARLRDQISAQKKRNREKEQQIKELKEKKADLTQKCSKKQGDLDAKRKQIYSEKKKLEEAENEYQTAQQEAAGYREELNGGYKVEDDDSAKSKKAGLKDPLL